MFRLPKIKSILFLLICVCPQGAALASGYLEQGKQYYAAGQLDKAGRYFQAEVASDPKSATAHYLLGNVFVGLKRRPEAIKEYQAALELDGNGQVCLASSLFAAGDSLNCPLEVRGISVQGAGDLDG